MPTTGVLRTILIDTPQLIIQMGSRGSGQHYSVIERVSKGLHLKLFARRGQLRWPGWSNDIDSEIAGLGIPMRSDDLRMCADEASA